MKEFHVPLECPPGSQLLLAQSAIELLSLWILGACLLMLPHPFDMPEIFLATKLTHMLLGAMNWKMLSKPAFGGEYLLACATYELLC